MEIDYRLLLMKYIAHVGTEEGTDYLGRKGLKPEWLDDEEWEALVEAAEEAESFYDSDSRTYVFED
jgi:hypothetical protein